MKSILVELQCHQCFYHTYRKSETLVISDFETQVREQLLEDRYFTLRCPRCGNLIEFLHPLAYVDKDHSFILLIKAEKDVTKKDYKLYQDDTTSRKRLISDHEKIAEKIRIFEDDLDDRAIELLKVKLHMMYEKKGQPFSHITYHDVDRESSTIWFETERNHQSDMMAVIMNAYESIIKELPADDQQFHIIDEEWANVNL